MLDVYRNMNDQKVAVITGSSSGIGLESALILARNGYTTYATMRSPDKDTSMKAAVQNEDLPINVVQLDVTDGASVSDVIAKRAQDSASPYTELMQKVMASTTELAKNAS